MERIQYWLSLFYWYGLILTYQWWIVKTAQAPAIAYAGAHPPTDASHKAFLAAYELAKAQAARYAAAQRIARKWIVCLPNYQYLFVVEFTDRCIETWQQQGESEGMDCLAG